MSGKFPADTPDTDPCGILSLAYQISMVGKAIEKSPLVERLSAGTWRARRSYLRNMERVVRDWAKEAGE
jgi:hypothetical protein